MDSVNLACNADYRIWNRYFRQCDDACANGQYTAGTIGLSWASFMMGLPTGITISGNDSAIVTNPYAAFFAQDTWRVTPKLTLTLSLRSEWETGATERFNRMIVDYDKNLVLPISAAAEAAYAKNPIPEIAVTDFKVRGGAVYAGTPGAPDRAWGGQLMWLPRIGFGYQLDSKTVLRGGYGIFYDTLNVNSVSFGPNQTGFSRATNTQITNDNGVTWLAGDPKNLVSPLTDPFPIRSNANNTRFDEPLRNALGSMALFNTGNQFTYQADRHPRMQRWRGSIERQIGASNVVEVSYEGTYTTELNININNSGQVPSSFYSRSTVRDTTQDSNLNAQVTSPFQLANFADLKTTAPVIYQDMSTKGIFTSSTIQKANLIRGFSTGNSTTANPIGTARSSQFAASFNHRFSKGLTANVAYTAMVTKQATGFFQPWSGLDPISPQSPYWTRGGASPQRIAATFVYDLPFGKGQRFIQNAIASQAVGGWTLAGTYEAQPGGLISFQNNNAFYYGDVNNIKIDNPTFDHYFNTAGCVATAAAAGPGDIVAGTGPCTQGWEKRANFVPATYQARTLPYNIDGLRGPGYQQFNISATKTFRIKERITFQTRLDALNIFNHSFVNGPNVSATSSQFGQITGGAAQQNRFIQIQGHLRW